MTAFYTYAWQYGNRVLTRGYRDGKPFIEKDYFRPKLYVRSNEPSKYKGLFGEQLKPIEFRNPSEAREFMEKYDGIGNYPIYGQTDLTYQYLSEAYPEDEIPFDMSQMGIWSLDIETTADTGFPDVDDPREEVLLITVMNNNTKEIITWGTGEWTPVSDEVKDLVVEYIPCEDEYELLKAFGVWWFNNTPDIVTGWNIEFFDIPYLMTRCARVLGEESKNGFSPFNMTRKKVVKMMGKEHTLYDIKGVAQLDYLDLYKKFTYTVRESYKLD